MVNHILKRNSILPAPHGDAVREQDSYRKFIAKHERLIPVLRWLLFIIDAEEMLKVSANALS